MTLQPIDIGFADLRENREPLESALQKVSILIHCASSVQNPKTYLLVLRNLVNAIRGRNVRFIFCQHCKYRSWCGRV